MIDTMPFAWGESLEDLVGKRVTQCALSRICGVCGETLGRPIAFLGTPTEAARNAFHYPPMHLACAHTLLGRVAATEVVTTAGFEFVRPGREDDDKRPTFQPNSLV
jgi:hypothetical protein